MRTFFIFSPDKTIKLWKISERDKRPEGYNLKEEDGRYRDPTTVTTLRVSTLKKKKGSNSDELHFVFLLYIIDSQQNISRNNYSLLFPKIR